MQIGECFSMCVLEMFTEAGKGLLFSSAWLTQEVLKYITTHQWQH